METKNLKILFIPNWNVHHLPKDNPSIQAPDKYVDGEKYWFYKYFPEGTSVDILDIGKKSLIHWFEKKCHIYFLQPFKAFLKRNKYDIVISHGAQSGLFYELFSSFTKQKPQHLMFDIGGLNSSRVNLFEMSILRFILRKCPNIIVHSSAQINFYKQHYPKQAPNVRFIPFGADIEYFNSYAIDSSNNTIIAFGYAKRDYKTLCDAFCKIANKDYKLHIIGDTRLANEYSEFKNIQFSSRLPLNQLIENVSKCAFVVIPLPEFMYSYGQMSILQSMSMGKSLIITETTSTRDYISNAPGVIKTRPGNVEDMANAIEQMINTPADERHRLGLENLNYVKAHYNEKEMGNQIYEIVHDIFKKGMV